MTVMEMREAILAWCAQNENLSLAESRNPKELQVQLTGFGLQSILIAVSWQADVADRLVIHHTLTAPATTIAALPGDTTESKQTYFTRTIRELSFTHSGLLHCQTAYSNDALEVFISLPLFSDGFNRQVFLSSLGELAKVREQVDSLLKQWQEQADEISRFEAAIQQNILPAPESFTPAAVMTCPACQANNPPSSKFCNQCGQPIGCPACGSVVMIGSKFCNQCGHRLIKSE